MNGDDDNEERGDDGRPRPALESLEDYIRRHGLTNGDPQGGEFNGLNRVEAIERVRREDAYRDRVIEEYEAQQQKQGDNDSGRTSGAGENKPGDVPQLGDGSEGGVIRVLLENDRSPYLMPVLPLVSFCDTVQRMVASRGRYGVQRGVAEENCTAGAASPSVTGGDQGRRPIMDFSLVGFAADAVVQFMDVLISLYDRQKEALAKDPTASRKRRINDDAEEATIYNAIDKGTLIQEHIVEYLKLAHFLQCPSLEKPLVSILRQSIDSRNCMAICSLADALNLKALFEASINHVIERLDEIQGTSSVSPNENHETGGGAEGKRASSPPLDEDEVAERGEASSEVWASLPHELRSRVLTMRNVMRSSVIGRGSRASGLFFSGASEFLAIFREAIADQKERLAEARERREEVVRERAEEWRTARQPRGRWGVASTVAEKEFVYGEDVMYALDKIEKQARRLVTLESFYEEQRLIFREGGFESEILL